MKKNTITLWAIALLALVLLVFAKSFTAGSVIGTFTPSGSASQVWLYSAKDTFRANVQNNAFEIANVKAGTYILAVEGTATYKPTTRTGIRVNDGEQTSVGQIVMEQVK